MSVQVQVSRLVRRPRVRRGARRLARSARTGRDRMLARLRRLPLPAGLRQTTADLALWRPGSLPVPIDRLLLGGQNGLSGTEFAVRSCDLGWPSRRVLDGPHADLLRRGRARRLTDEEILGTPYGRMALDTIAATGAYFAATDPAGVVAVARRYLGPALDDGARSRAPLGRMPRQSRLGDPVRVAPIRHSDCYQVLDGHHRVAAHGVAGAAEVRVRVKRVAVSTPLQDLLEQMSWTGGERELYQPIDSPELEAGWVRVRRCVDRLDAMRRHLDRLDLTAGAGYLDVASCYGWFVDRLTRLGYDGHGVERDENAPMIGALAYGLDPARITVADAEAFLAGAERTWEVVSCFSLLHHFALGRASVGPEELLGLLDRVTGRVLFLDTGQGHEAWFSDSLPDWDPDHVRALLARHTTFDEIVDLGPDADAVPPYQRNYGRHLFAATRHS